MTILRWALFFFLVSMWLAFSASPAYRPQRRISPLPVLCLRRDLPGPLILGLRSSDMRRAAVHAGKLVMPGLVRASTIGLQAVRKTWMAGTSPGMTEEMILALLKGVASSQLLDLDLSDRTPDAVISASPEMASRRSRSRFRASCRWR